MWGEHPILSGAQLACFKSLVGVIRQKASLLIPWNAHSLSLQFCQLLHVSPP